MQKIRSSDTVQVISGNDKGLRGEVSDYIRGWRVNRAKQRIRDPKQDQVVISGLNIVKKHQRPISQTRTQTGIIELEAPVHISNVMLVCPSCDEPVRVGVNIDDDGRKHRVCKRCGGNVD